MITHETNLFYEQFPHLEDEYLDSFTYSGGELFEDQRIQSYLVGRYGESDATARSMVCLARLFGSYTLGKAMTLARAMELAESEQEEKTHEERRKLAIKILEENPYVIGWSYDHELTDAKIIHYFKDKAEDPDLTPEMYLEMSFLDDLECEYSDHRDDVYQHVESILERNGFTYEERGRFLDDESLASECPVDGNVKHFLNQKVDIRFELVSGYGCMNSAWFETDNFRQPFPTNKAYLGDVLTVLQLHPAKLNEAYKAIRFEPFADQSPFDDGDPIVDDKQFFHELINTNCGANLLTIAAKIPFRDLANKTFTIPKGTPVGFYSDLQGGGSMFECALLCDFYIVLPDKPTNDPHWRMVADCHSGCSMVACYGDFLE